MQSVSRLSPPLSPSVTSWRMVSAPHRLPPAAAHSPFEHRPERKNPATYKHDIRPRMRAMVGVQHEQRQFILSRLLRREMSELPAADLQRAVCDAIVVISGLPEIYRLRPLSHLLNLLAKRHIRRDALVAESLQAIEGSLSPGTWKAIALARNWANLVATRDLP